MREIGGEFWDVPIKKCGHGFFPESVQWYLSGRSALKSIIVELQGCHTVAMPSWCCESMIRPFVDSGLEVEFYPVYWMDGLVQEERLDCDVLFLMDYFGYTLSSEITEKYHGVVLRDVTHSIFSTSYNDADYYFGSLRKWCGVWTGGYVWTNDGHSLPMQNGDDYGFAVLREKAMQQKNSFIHGWGVVDKGYLELFEEAEDSLERVGIGPAADRDIALALDLDAEYIKTQRRKNAQIIKQAFPDWLIFREMATSDTPMFVPIIVPDGRRDELRKYLVKNEIYCPIHWPVCKYHKLDKRTAFLYNNELSLVCDQRYSEEDMCRIVETIRMFMEEV
ncbi:MAG: hypothetical protein IJ655_03230 [Lachnospiraceae bacterium]|nr:hypothetical protein [Lachnospiraceae bacterium]